MDYWDYIAHSQQGAERKDHRYYARVQTGTSNGRAVYRYFYTADEYSAYRNAANRNVEKQKNAARREVTRTNILADKVKMDAERYRKKRFAEGSERRKKEKRAMDWERTQSGIRSQKADMDKERNKRLRGEKHAQRVTEAKAQQVKKDAEAYRKKRRNAAKAKRIGEQHSMDRKRWASNNAKSIGEQHSADRKRWDTEARRKKRAEAKKRRDFQKRVMDNTRTRKSYQPKTV